MWRLHWRHFAWGHLTWFLLVITYYFNQARLWLHRFLIGLVKTVLVFPSKFITAYRHLPPTSTNCQGKVSPSLCEQWSWQFGQQCSWSSPGNVGCHFSQVSKCFSTTLGLTSRFDVSMCFCLWPSYHRWSCKRLAWQRVLVDFLMDCTPCKTTIFHQHFGRRFFSFCSRYLKQMQSCKSKVYLESIADLVSVLNASRLFLPEYVRYSEQQWLRDLGWPGMCWVLWEYLAASRSFTLIHCGCKKPRGCQIQNCIKIAVFLGGDARKFSAQFFGIKHLSHHPRYSLSGISAISWSLRT